MYKLCTVDIWDTLLRRRCHPEAIKLAVAQHVLLRCHDKIIPELRAQWPLYRARLEAELAVAQQAREAGQDDEYELREVFQHWLSVACPDMGPSEREHLVADLREHELQVEIQNTFADEGILSVLQEHPAERILYLSDFYIAGDLLDRLLSHHGFDKCLAGGVVSCDVGLNKRSGNLFRYIQDREGVPPSEHIHIGDNPHSDVYMPAQYGIKGVLYQPAEAHAARSEREGLFVSRDALFNHIRNDLTLEADAAAPCDNEKARGMFLLGVQSAPLFIGFAMHVAERAQIDRLEHVSFLTREGTFFYRVFQTLFPQATYMGLKSPPADMLEVSRIATFLGSLKSITVNELKRIWRLNEQQNISTLMGILDLDIQVMAPILARYGLESGTLLNRPQDDPRVQALLLDADFRTAAMEAAKSRRQLIVDYLTARDIPIRGRVGVVDIGWRGTIQDNLAVLLPDVHWVGYYIALRKFLNPQAENVDKHAYVLDERHDDEKHLFESFEPLELLCNSGYGSTVSYARQSDGRVVALKDPKPKEQSVSIAYTSHFQNGVVFATAAWAPYLLAYAVSSEEIQPLALKVWSQISNNPPSQLIDAYYAAPQHDLFGFGGDFHRDAVPSLATILMGVFNRRKRREVVFYVRRTQWTAAVHGLKIGRLHKVALLGVFYAAKLYKRIVLMRRN
jgi:FMN phosphatase YigB (HAD superfamily)